MPRFKIYGILWLTMVATLLGAATSPIRAEVEPADIMVVYNRRLPASLETAQYYAERRQVPAANLIGLDLPDTETIPRQVFDLEVAQPLRRLLDERRAAHPPVLLLVYGMPMSVGAPPLVDGDQRAARLQAEIAPLVALVTQLTDELQRLVGESPPASRDQSVPALVKEAEATLKQAIKFANGAISPEAQLRIQAIAIRLAGLEPFARQAAGQPQAPTNAGAGNLLPQLSAVLHSQMTRLQFTGIPEAKEAEASSLIRANNGLLGELVLRHELGQLDSNALTSAAVDSELALLLVAPVQLARWLPNPYHAQFDRMPGIQAIRDQTLMVARLDGPSPDIARRLVDDAIWAEENGLQGTFYIDARGLGSKKGFYGEYDQHLRDLETFLRKKTRLPVVLDDRPDLFGPNACPDTALYCGWYSLANYVDSFKWRRGAIGFHVASGEATTLKKKDSNVWCKRMLEEGIAATLGPVQEPYLQSFPLPDVFFPLLLTGKLPLIEVYYQSTPFLSWRQVLIGDPLYNPFRGRSAVLTTAPP